MAQKIRMTSKRQVTFPAAVCESLAIYPGDTLTLKDARVKGRKVWIFEPQPAEIAYPWLGSLREYAERKGTHAMSEIRAAVALKRCAQG
jgi:bifunctional DNA-binding transcriptional regulator/antitoxin component of YhaV-PrlF toxin-antitoxin module